MVTISVILSGRLRLEGYGRGHPTAPDGTLPLALEDGSTIRGAIDAARVPTSRVVMTMLNGHGCGMDVPLSSGDRIVLVPEDVATLWRALGRQGLGMGIGSDS